MRNSRRPDIGGGGLLEQLDRYPVTYGVILANLLIFGFCATRTGGFSASIPNEVLRDLGANHYQWLQIQPWRVVTAAFLHTGLMHVAFNMIAMYVIGRIMEIHYGAARTWVIYVACFVGGGLASAAAQAAQGGPPSVGASGGVFGLILCGYVYAVQNPARLGGVAQQLRGWILFALLFSLFMPNIDHAGHAGGAAVGALFGWKLQPKPGADPHAGWVPLAHVLAVLCLACFALVAFALRRAGMA